MPARKEQARAPSRQRFELRCAEIHAVGCNAMLRAASSRGVVALACEHGALAHGFTGVVHPEAACRHCRSGDAGPALGAHRVVWCPAGAARDAPGYAGLRRWFERFALGLDPVAALGELAHGGAHEHRPQQPV